MAFDRRPLSGARDEPGGGRPPIPPRACLEGILWVLISGARWKDLPTHFPSPASLRWCRLQEWTESGLFQQAWARLLHRLDGLKSLRWDETMADGTFSPAKKGGLASASTTRGKGTKIMLLVDGRGTPLGVDIASASPAEVQLIEPLLKQRILRRRPKRLIYDRAADSDPLRTRLAKRCIELICPHRRGRIRPPTQDGRPLRRYKRRWIIERTISWLFNYRPVVCVTSDMISYSEALSSWLAHSLF